MTSTTDSARKVASASVGTEASRTPAVIAAAVIGCGCGMKRRPRTKAAKASSNRYASGSPASSISMAANTPSAAPWPYLNSAPGLSCIGIRQREMNRITIQ